MRAVSDVPKIANLIIDRLKLVPPVDVDAAIAEYADLEECSWKYDCDGVAWLAADRPRIFIKRNSPRRRKRFTKAHELGHVVIGWHLGNVKCVVNPADDDHHQSLKAEQEREANLFASHLLVPDSLISEIGLSYYGVPDALGIVEKADVSAAAGIVALCRVLLPGYVFQVSGVGHPIVSNGTDLPSSRMRDLEEIAIRCGVVVHQEREVRWMQLADAQEVIETNESPEDLLRYVLARARPYQPLEQIKASINGVIGGVTGSNSFRANMMEPEQLLGMLKYKFEMHCKYSDLMNYPQFRKFLSCRAVEVASQRKRRRMKRKSGNGDGLISG